jgi:four helix bundle protein
MDRNDMIARTEKFAVDIVKFCEPLLLRVQSRKPAEQLLEAGTSVASNYRAACRGRSRAEFIAKLGVANEESDEAVFWLWTLERSGLATGREVDRLLQEATELRAIIARSRSTALANNRQASTTRTSTNRQINKSKNQKTSKSPNR